MYDFQVGDRVVRVRETNGYYRNVPIGFTGTVLHKYVAPDHNGGSMWVAMVEWDREPPRGGHSCSGRCEDGYGWNLPFADLEYTAADVDCEPFNPVSVDDLRCLLGDAYA